MKSIIVDTIKQIGLALAITLFVSAAPSYAGIGGEHDRNEHKPTHDRGGKVLPPTARPKGYSLTDMANATAAFNVTDHSGRIPRVINGKPFQGLYTTSTNTFNVKKDTILYVPVMQNDDSEPVLGIFPDLSDRKALVDYFYSENQAGVKDTKIVVDGKETLLNQHYLVGLTVDPLPTGATHYMTVAAFLTPLNKGQHTVVISARLTGADVVPWCEKINAIYGFTFCTTEYSFTIPYIVNVR